MKRMQFIRQLVANLQKPSNAEALVRIIDETWDTNYRLLDMAADYRAWDPSDLVTLDPVVVRRHADHSSMWYTRDEDDKILLKVEYGVGREREEADAVECCDRLNGAVMKHNGMNIGEWITELRDCARLFRRAAEHFGVEPDGGHVDYIDRRFKLPVERFANVNRGWYVVDDPCVDDVVNLMFIDFDCEDVGGGPTVVTSSQLIDLEYIIDHVKSFSSKSVN